MPILIPYSMETIIPTIFLRLLHKILFVLVLCHMSHGSDIKLLDLRI